MVFFLLSISKDNELLSKSISQQYLQDHFEKYNRNENIKIKNGLNPFHDITEPRDNNIVNLIKNRICVINKNQELE